MEQGCHTQAKEGDALDQTSSIGGQEMDSLELHIKSAILSGREGCCEDKKKHHKTRTSGGM